MERFLQYFRRHFILNKSTGCDTIPKKGKGLRCETFDECINQISLRLDALRAADFSARRDLAVFRRLAVYGRGLYPHFADGNRAVYQSARPFGKAA